MGLFWFILTKDTNGRAYYYIVEGPVKKETVLRDFIKNAKYFSRRPTYRKIPVIGEPGIGLTLGQAHGKRLPLGAQWKWE
ncbi:hypothetical protein [Thermococcus sp. 2319x1]|uniref:hypothetical protein n=1 Tax=Thermococcus sp. 2319x1 TaxID=1674923 RepID=UPI0015823B25|nr:hypothetical protein [Thermococcus sp. 2319x1]